MQFSLRFLFVEMKLLNKQPDDHNNNMKSLSNRTIINKFTLP